MVAQHQSAVRPSRSGDGGQAGRDCSECGEGLQIGTGALSGWRGHAADAPRDGHRLGERGPEPETDHDRLGRRRRCSNCEATQVLPAASHPDWGWADEVPEGRKDCQPAQPAVEYQKGARVHTGLVLSQGNTGPFDSSNFRHRFAASVRIAHGGSGRSRRKLGHVRIHDLPHTYASGPPEAGVPINEVARLLGHGSVQNHGALRTPRKESMGQRSRRAPIGSSTEITPLSPEDPHHCITFPLLGCSIKQPSRITRCQICELVE